MKNFFKMVSYLLKIYGLDFSKMFHNVFNTFRFVKDFLSYKSKNRTAKDFSAKVSDLIPILDDYHDNAGSINGYLYQDLWAARKIYKARPASHVDIGSRVDGFITNLLVFMKVKVIDVRPLKSSIKGLDFIQADATELKGVKSNSIKSLSSLHAVEHFGLGRYTDPIGPDSWRKAIHSLERVLAKGGKLYFSVPIGRERLNFNAHRVFDVQTILDEFKGLKLVSFSYVDDNNNFFENVNYKKRPLLSFGYGLFEFSKI